MFKAGERVRLTDKCQYIGNPYGYNVGDIGYIVEDKCQDGLVVKMENLKNSYDCLWCFARELEHAEKTPPQKIQQNGYEYSLVGPVKPDWLVDGAWVVRKDNGCKHQVVLNKNGLLVLTVPGTDYAILPNRHIYDQYRPHEPKDWKWGDWAMYDGKRVFVMSSIAYDNLVGISFPNIAGKNLTDPSEQWYFAEEYDLTPTF